VAKNKFLGALQIACHKRFLGNKFDLTMPERFRGGYAFGGAKIKARSPAWTLMAECELYLSSGGLYKLMWPNSRPLY